MRRILLIFALVPLFLAGCAADDNNSANVASSAVQILSPFSGSRHFAFLRWQAVGETYSYPCSYGFIADTALLAHVTVLDVPGGVHSAQIYQQDTERGEYEATGQVVYPVGRTFDIPFFRPYGGYNSYFQPYRDTQEVSFCVGIIAGDESFHLSGPIHCTVEVAPEYFPPAIPAAPFLRDAEENPDYYGDGIRIEWCNLSGNVDDIDIFYQSPYDPLPRVLTSEQPTWAWLQNYIPQTDYAVWLRARNVTGMSLPSDTLRVTTGEPALPTSLQIYSPQPHNVYLSWNNRRYCDSLLVARRADAGTWQTIANVIADEDQSYFTDTTAVSGSYVYRLGLSFPTGTWWSPDSLHVAIP